MNTLLVIAMTVIFNQDRVGLNKLSPDVQLSQVAQTRVHNLCVNNQFSHEGFEDVMKQSGLKYKYAGENLARRYNDIEQMNIAFMESPTHKANIMSEKYQSVGVAQECGITVILFR